MYTVCTWRCEHARFRVDVFMRQNIRFYSFIRAKPKVSVWNAVDFHRFGFLIFVLLGTSSSSSSVTTDFLTRSEDQCHFYS